MSFAGRNPQAVNFDSIFTPGDTAIGVGVPDSEAFDGSSSPSILPFPVANAKKQVIRPADTPAAAAKSRFDARRAELDSLKPHDTSRNSRKRPSNVDGHHDEQVFKDTANTNKRQKSNNSKVAPATKQFKEKQPKLTQEQQSRQLEVARGIQLRDAVRKIPLDKIEVYGTLGSGTYGVVEDALIPKESLR